MSSTTAVGAETVVWELKLGKMAYGDPFTGPKGILAPAFGTPSNSAVFKSILFWPCRTAKIFGYWPFTYSKGQLIFKWKSWGFLFTALNLLVMSSSLIIMETQRKTMIRTSKEPAQNTTQPGDGPVRMSATESVGHMILVFVQSIAVIFLLLVSLSLRNKILALHVGFHSAFGNVAKGTVVAAHADMLIARRKVKTVLVTFLVLATARVTLMTTKVATRSYPGDSLVRAAARVGVYFIWNLIMPMVTTWLTIVYGFVLILGNAFGILAEELERDSGMHAQKTRRVEEILDHARQLRKVLEVMNESLKIPLVGLFVFMIIALTVSIFFATVGAAKHWQLVVFCLLTLAIYMLAIYVLSSAGEEVVNKARRYGEALGRIEGQTEALRFRIQMEVLRMGTDPPTVSPGHYFTLRSQLMSAIIGVLTSYSIILVQFNNGDRQSAPSCPDPGS